LIDMGIDITEEILHKPEMQGHEHSIVRQNGEFNAVQA
jgi:hypothetical protein